MKEVRPVKLPHLMILLLSCAAMGVAGAQEADILRESDARYIPESFRYTMTIVTVNSRGAGETTRMVGRKKGNEKNLLIIKEPAALSGIVHLRKGPSIWTYYPTLKKNMKTSFQSLVLGSVLSYGDLMALSLAEEYGVTSKTIEDDQYKLMLTPLPKKEGYAHVFLWLDRHTLLPRKREYYSKSDILLKTCTIAKIDLDSTGAVREIIQEFYEPLRKSTTTVRISGISADPAIADRDFNPEYLKFISGE
jgi:outer membrane lipoprotein-sorting protein